MPTIKVLVVEDEQLVAEDIRETLESLGYEVTALAISGEEALHHVAVLQPHLVLMDIRLAGAMDGVAASEQIQSQFHIPVVYLTANADRTTLQRVKATHPYGYILKPFDDRILATTIEIALSRHEAEVEVRRAKDSAEQEKQAAEAESDRKSRYLSIASHELRNPLATIKIATEVLQRHWEDLPEERKRRHLQRINQASDCLNALLEDMLTLIRADSGNLEFRPALMDIVSFCQEQVEAWQFSTDDRHRFTLTVQGDFRTAYLDEKLMWHLFNNLLSNAVKYSPQGGTISLTIRCTGEEVWLQVQDEGIGIPSEAQATLFEPFHRASNVGAIPGTGLGLTIIQHCVKLHGGQVRVESQVNQGTTFTITLPQL